MATSFTSREWTRSANMLPRARRLGTQMTRHVAAALLLFTVMQIWLVSAAIDVGAPRTITIAAMVILVIAALPYARITERRWQALGQQALPSPALMDRFRRDTRMLWLLAASIPAAWTGAVWLFV
ncbi:MAG: hypothetical protein HC788_06240 [Sphingopyxis sp.]|nr:hypothetical protein [Sphingopyxis sp.]